jgi:hypothetical protein
MTPADSRRIRLVADGVVASYIHDISARTGSPATPDQGHRVDGTVSSHREEADAYDSASHL